MIERLKSQLRHTTAQRKELELPKVGWIVAVSVIGTVAYIFLAIILIPSGETRDFHFGKERGAITALSAILLAMAAAFSMATQVLLVRTEARHRWSWAILFFSFTFFAFDELLEFHERLGFVLERHADPGIFRNWNDVVVTFYGLLAVPIMVLLLPTLIRHRMLLEMFVIAFAFYGIHTLIDSMIEPKTTLSVILEESAKLFSAGFLAIGSFVGFLGALWNATQTNKL